MLAAAFAAAIVALALTAGAGASRPATLPLVGIHKIQHVVVIMQENRSFDEYFGTYPGADGIPMHDGHPTVCVPDPMGPCKAPVHDPNDINSGGPHDALAAVGSVDSGRMDGFVSQAEHGKGCGTTIPDCTLRISSANGLNAASCWPRNSRSASAVAKCVIAPTRLSPTRW